MDVVELSRLQFAATAMYHFIFVPLTLGLSIIIAIMESVYVMTGRQIWRDMTKFWGKLFGINFAMGVATGLPLEFQFGMNWAYYSHYVGDVFGSLLALEGLMAFFLEATFIGLFFFGWDRLSKVQHMIVTWLMALGTNFSALWILIANAWMQNPVGTKFNFESMRMEMTSFYDIFFNPAAQAKFVHTVSAGYVTGAMFVLSISAYYLSKKIHREFALRSLTIAASFGLAASLSVVVLGDESGYTATQHQKMKIAALEAMWETEPAPAGLIAFGIPNVQKQTVEYQVKVPWILGLIATRSFNTPIPGINDLIQHAEKRIKNGLISYDALQKLRKNPKDAKLQNLFRLHEKDLGYALLLKKYVEDPRTATPKQIKDASHLTVPNVPSMFWSFRMMVGIGMFMVILFASAFYLSCRRRFENHPNFLRIAKYSLPLPWIASELGWFVAEHGRQPWTIDGVLPTFLSASNIPASNVLISLTIFVLFYSILAIVDFHLIKKYVRFGPDIAR